MAQEVELIQLDPADDVTSVKDRFAYLRGRSVLLIWPEKGTTLNRKLDLVLLQREAKRLAIRFALVTHDPDVTRYAAELNISTFETIGSSARGKWLRGRTRTFANREQKPEDDPEPGDLMPIASRVRVESTDTPLARIVRFVIRAIILAILLGLAAILTYLLVPSAIITLTPARETVSLQADIRADADAAAPDVNAGIIPAILLRVEIEERGATPTTGAQQVGSALATGSVIFINRTTSTIDIPADLIVSTAESPPRFFRTLQSASVSAGVGLQVEVPIEALPDNRGELGNVPAGAITVIVGLLADSLEVRNVTPTAGGESRAVRAVTASDRESLLAILRQQLQTRAYIEMLPQLSESQFLMVETIRIAEERADWTVYDYAVGDVTDTLTLTMRVVVEALAVDARAAEQIAFSRLAADIPRGRTIRAVTYERSSATMLSDGRVAFTVRADATVEAQIDTAALRERLVGKSRSEAANYVRENVDIDSNAPVSVVIAPDGLENLPILPLRIAIQLAERAP
jgi:hypothetical protein